MLEGQTISKPRILGKFQVPKSGPSNQSEVCSPSLLVPVSVLRNYLRPVLTLSPVLVLKKNLKIHSFHTTYKYSTTLFLFQSIHSSGETLCIGGTVTVFFKGPRGANHENSCDIALLDITGVEYILRSNDQWLAV